MVDPRPAAAPHEPHSHVRGTAPTRSDWLVTAGVVALLAVLTVYRLPPGVCFGDAGGFQLAAATLGITHPPGYAGYVTAWYLLSRVPGVEPAYIVSLSCLAASLAVVAVLMLVQVRLGVPVGLAGAAALGLTAHPRFWSNMLAPEVYMLSLSLPAVAMYLLVRYGDSGRRWYSLAAAFLLGAALANRPPIALMLPFFVGAWWLAHRRWAISTRHAVGKLVAMVAVALVPGLYSLGFLWIRDTADAPYNYLEQFNAETGELPPVDGGAVAKARRIAWLVTGRQFRDRMGNDWRGVRAKLRWLRTELLWFTPVTVVIGPSVHVLDGFIAALFGLMMIIGAIVACRRSSVATACTVGLGIGSLGFVCLYRMYGGAADILPLLFAITVLIGVAVSVPLHHRSPRMKAALGYVLLGVMAVATVVHVPRRADIAATVNAEPYLAELDMPTLPRGAVICSDWGHSTPLWYAQYVRYRRDDILVMNARERAWQGMTVDKRDRPILATSRPQPWDGYDVQRYRNLWRLEPTPATGQP